MNDQESLDGMRHIVLADLKQRMGNVDIDDVSVERAVDHDDDDILVIKIVFKAGNRRLDPRKTSGMVRHIRPKMTDIGEDAFPVFSFIADSELRATRAETGRPH